MSSDQTASAGTGSPTRFDVWIERERVRLAGRLVLPAGRPPYASIVFVHGLGSGKDSPRNMVIAEHLVDAGVAVLLFDLSGHGGSDADARGEAAFIDDTTAAFRWASRHPELDPDRIGIAGSSLGGTVALEAVRAGQISPAAMVLRAPPVDPGGFARVAVPTLVIVGSRDPLRRQIEEAARGTGVAVHVVHGAGHLFEEPGTLELALEATTTWFTSHLLAASGGRR